MIDSNFDFPGWSTAVDPRTGRQWVSPYHCKTSCKKWPLKFKSNYQTWLPQKFTQSAQHSFLSELLALSRYYINLLEKTTHWDDPRLKFKQVYGSAIPMQDLSRVSCWKTSRKCPSNNRENHENKTNLLDVAWLPQVERPSLSHSKLSSPSISKLSRSVDKRQSNSVDKKQPP